MRTLMATTRFDDPFEPEAALVRARLSVLTRRRVPGGIMAGCHDGAFWGRHWPTALEFITAQFTAAQSTAARPFTAAQ